MIEINYVYNAGFRCNASKVLAGFKFRNISSPFDYMFIDIETCFENINNKFQNFMRDIVLINKDKKIYDIYYSDKEINKKINSIQQKKNISYLKYNYNNINVLINQNYIKNVSSNLYFWDRICVHIHHNISEKLIFKKIKKRVNTFRKIYDLFSNKLCLFYLTKIIEITNLDDYKKYIFKLKKKYNIKAYLIIIICSDRIDDTHIFENDILFIVKKVDNYDQQLEKIERKKKRRNKIVGDNEINFDDKLDIINKYFKMNLLNYDQIKKKFM